MRAELFNGKVPEVLKPYSLTGANYGAVTEGRRNQFSNRIDEFISEGNKKPAELKILDVGASSGTFVELAIQKGLKAEGIEPSETGVREAAKRGIKLVHSVAEQIPFPDNTFDIVHSHHVFEHLSDPMMAAREIYRVLKPGGFMFIEVPNQLDNIMFFRDRLFNRIPQRQRNIRSIHHLYFFSKKTMHKLLGASGFKNVSVQTRYSFQAHGWRKLGSLMTRAVGIFYLGGDIVQAKASK